MARWLLTLDGREYVVAVEGERITVDGHEFQVLVEGSGRSLTVQVNGHPYSVELPDAPDSALSVRLNGRELPLEVKGGNARRPAARPPEPRHAEATTGAVVAPMAGRIVRLAVAAGDRIEAGDLLLILEAMKMENEIRAPRGGSVSRMLVEAGQRVAQGQEMLAVE